MKPRMNCHRHNFSDAYAASKVNNGTCAFLTVVYSFNFISFNPEFQISGRWAPRIVDRSCLTVYAISRWLFFLCPPPPLLFFNSRSFFLLLETIFHSCILGHASFFLCFSLCARIDFRQSPKKKKTQKNKCAFRFAVWNPTTKFACPGRYRRLCSIYWKNPVRSTGKA